MLIHSTIVEVLRRDAEAAARLAAHTARVCADHAAADFGPMSRFFARAALAMQGNAADGLSEMLPALVEHRGVVGSHVSDLMLGLIATTYGQTEQWNEGLRRVDEGIALCESTLERVYVAELWRVKGELLLGKAGIARSRQRAGTDSAVDAARRCFRRALKIARSQEARSLELRSAMSLTRLSAWRGAPHDARTLLRSLVGSFTEGLDTKDLKDAKALLNNPEPGRERHRQR